MESTYSVFSPPIDPIKVDPIKELPIAKPKTHKFTDLFLCILFYIDFKDISRSCSRVNKEWHQLAKEDSLWRRLVTDRLFPLEPRKGSTWRREFIISQRWEKGIFTERVEEDKEETQCHYHEQPLLSLGVVIFYQTGQTNNQIEVCDQKGTKQLYSFCVKKELEEVPVLPLNEVFKKSCWNLTIKVQVDNKEEEKLSRHLQLCFRRLPISLSDNDYQTEVIAKINHLYLYIKDLLTKNLYIRPMFSHNPNYQYTVYQNGKEVWIIHEAKLKIHKSLTLELIQELDIPNFTHQPNDFALLFNRILILVNQNIEIYYVENNSIQKKWTIPVQETSKKTFIIPTDYCPYFGLYNRQDQILEIFDSTKGKAVCSFKNFYGNRIFLDTSSIRYLNEKNQVVTRSFDFE